MSTQLTITNAQSNLTARRLVLAKQLYLHGLEHSKQLDAINKMIAVHNFHNAIEIVLRAVISQFDINSQADELGFMALVRAIKNHPEFKQQGKRLKDIANLDKLNKLRTLVQHDASEPPTGTMEQWRVLTAQFLEDASQTYFGIAFDGLSPLDFISDELIRDSLKLSLDHLRSGNLRQSIRLSKATFQLAEAALIEFLPSHGIIPTTDDGYTRALLESVQEHSREAKYFAILLWSGVNPIDLKRLESITPDIQFSETGNTLSSWSREAPNRETTEWINRFVVDTLIHWQSIGIEISLKEWGRTIASKLIDEDKIDSAKLKEMFARNGATDG